ncbi:non-ribosomal peptide synthetase [Nocardia spumae]|uniref:non-ribosomal peptide synthetase n=1 Tax=Nocardia spumae TaxID=2887190 RepID=UPI001D155694|nr:amino acid adenylation domain-containing protein [Nocardia spumae]
MTEHHGSQRVSRYRRAMFADAEHPELPTDRPRPAESSGARLQHTREISARVAEGLRGIARQHGRPLHEVLLTVFAVVLGKYSRYSDITACSLDPAGLLFLRADTTGDPAFAALLDRATTEIHEARGGLDVPLGRFPDIAPSFAEQSDGGVRISIDYDHDLFDEASIERMAHGFAALLATIGANPAARLSELCLLDEDERRRLLIDTNDTAADPPPDLCVHQLVAQQAHRTPDHVAIVSEGGSLTYRDLDEQANRLAHRLRELGVRTDTSVVVCAERGPRLIIALLAVLKAGGAYVPLDPGLPEDRLALMHSDCGASVLLTRTHLLSRVQPGEDCAVFDLDADWPALENMPSTDPASAAGPHDLAYIIYTSGSTGTPKGVQIEHRGVVNFLAFARDRLGIGPQDTVGQESTAAFDIFTFECWAPLTAGATLVVIRREDLLSPDTLRHAIIGNRLSVLRLPASLLVGHLRTEPDLLAGLDTVCYGGEVVDRSVMDDLMSGPHAPKRLVHWYGPTETTVISTSYPVDHATPAGHTMPIGRPIHNTRVYVVDPHGQPVPEGVPGELWIGGVGVARGYLNAPELNREKFGPDPFADDPSARLYRTGDIVRWLPDGNLQFLHRQDNQVKVRGFRIEPGEIEATVLAHEGIAQCVVVTHGDGDDKLLVAYCVAGRSGRPDGAELRALVARRLPEYMVPQRWDFLDTLPTTISGKIDRRALAARNPVRFVRGEGRGRSAGPVEAAITEVWREVLGLTDIGPDDNFFELGGHSLMGTRVVKKVHTATGVQMKLKDFIRKPTIAAMTAFVAAHSASDAGL